MDAALRPHLTFHVTSRRLHAEVFDRIHESMRPALLARYRDLTSLRYDFPLVLIDSADDVRSLSGLVDGALQSLSSSDDLERLTRHAYQIEREIRTLVASGVTGRLSSIWERAADGLGAPGSTLRESLRTVRDAIRDDGILIDCAEGTAEAVLTHLWHHAQAAKAARFQHEVERLVVQLSDILRADHAASDAGRSAAALRTTIGGFDRDELDFDAWSQAIRTARHTPIPERRRARLERLIAILESQRFFTPSGDRDRYLMPHAFSFSSAVAALDAYQARTHELVELAGALSIAKLEADGEFDEDLHEELFDQWDAGRTRLVEDRPSMFPDYLVMLNAGALDSAEHAALTLLLTSGVPVKVLLVTDDVLEQEPVGDGRFGLGSRNWQFVHIALGATDVDVVQIAASQLVSERAALQAVVRSAGPSLVSVFSGVSPGTRHLPPYVTAAAALESRAFPALHYTSGADRSPALSIEANPQPGADWPIYDFAYDDVGHGKASEAIAFTLADFVVADARSADHFADVPQRAWAELVPVAAHVAAQDGRKLDRLPYVPAVDAAHVLHRLVIDEPLARETARCLRRWHTLRDLADRHRTPQVAAAEADRSTPASEPVAPPASPVAAASDAAPEISAERSSGDPYIETPRCSTCNECTQINNRMFAYNENKQAYIADAKAGSYAQLVEAAESCQVSIIHPGMPLNPNEPGLDELIKRAEAFR